MWPLIQWLENLVGARETEHQVSHDGWMRVDVRASDPQGSDIIAGSEKLDSQIVGLIF